MTYVTVLRDVRDGPGEEDYGFVAWLDVRFGAGDAAPQCLGPTECGPGEDSGNDMARAPACRAWGPCGDAAVTETESHRCGLDPQVGYADLDGNGTPEHVARYWVSLCDAGWSPADAWYRELSDPPGHLRDVELP